MAVHRPRFHPLPIGALERLCEDAVAVTFDVPADLADEFAFRPGQSLTLRRIVDGADERRSYSLCSPVGGPLRIAVREVPGGLFSHWLVSEAKTGESVEVLPPQARSPPTRPNPANTCWSRPAPASPRCSPSPPPSWPATPPPGSPCCTATGAATP